ncbi:MAG: DUF2062 domain-containing protein [bacterium]
MPTIWQRKVVQPIIRLLEMGTTPEKIALSIAFGIMLGVFPVLGTTTILCTIAAFALKLNLPAIQLVNYLVYPLQILLLIPFYRAGEHLFGQEPSPLSFAMVAATFEQDFWNATRVLWGITWHAVVVWCLLTPGVIFVTYRVLTPLVRRLSVGGRGSRD